MEKITKTGKRYETKILRNHSHTVIWEISSEAWIPQDEVIQAIESEYPSPGYGASSFTRRFRLNDRKYVVEVESNNCCD